MTHDVIVLLSALGVVGMVIAGALDFFPPVRTTASTTATTISRRTPATPPSTFGEAWRTRGPPFDWTGGGAFAAAWRASLLFLPLAIGRKRSGGLGGVGGRER